MPISRSAMDCRRVTGMIIKIREPPGPKMPKIIKIRV